VKLSSLKDLLNNKYSIHLFNDEVAKELENNTNLIDLKGASRPIIVNEDIDWTLGINEIKVLLKLYIDNNINENAIEYICDGLEMAESVTYEDKIADILFYLSNPDINGKNTIEKTNKILEELLKE